MITDIIRVMWLGKEPVFTFVFYTRESSDDSSVSAVVCLILLNCKQKLAIPDTNKYYIMIYISPPLMEQNISEKREQFKKIKIKSLGLLTLQTKKSKLLNYQVYSDV